MGQHIIENIPVKNSSSKKARLLRLRGEPCFIGERELAVIADADGSVSSCGELLLLERLSRQCDSRISLSLESSASSKSRRDGGILVTEYSLDTNESLLLDYSTLLNGAFKSVIAPFFGMQLLSMASKFGVLLVPLPLAEIKSLRNRLVRIGDKTLEIDLTSQVITARDNTMIEFQTATWHRNRLLNGLDDTDEIMALKGAKENYLETDMKRRPWLYF